MGLIHNLAQEIATEAGRDSCYLPAHGTGAGAAGGREAGRPPGSGPAARREGRLTLIQVDIVLPLLLVPRAVVSGALQDVSPVSDVMPNGHLLQPTVRVPYSPPSLPDLGGGRAWHTQRLLPKPGYTSPERPPGTQS